SATAQKRKLQRVEHIGLGKSRVVPQQQRNHLLNSLWIVCKVRERRRPHVVSNDGNIIFRLDELREEHRGRTNYLVSSGLHAAAAVLSKHLSNLAELDDQRDRDRRIWSREVGDVFFHAIDVDFEVALL